MPPPASAILPGFSVPGFLTELQHVHSLAVASLTLFLYDIILTLDDEIKYIHRGSRWSLPKCLYLMNRYFVLLLMVMNSLILLFPVPPNDVSLLFPMMNDANPPHSSRYLAHLIPVPNLYVSCLFATRYSSLGGIFTKLILDLWLVLRVYALWNRDRRIFAILISAYITNAAVSLTITGMSTKLVEPIFVSKEERYPGMTGCALKIPPGPNDLWITFVSCVTYEAIVVSFTIAKGLIQWKAGFAHAKTPLTKHLYQTGVGYFIAMALVMIVMSAAALSPLQFIVLPTQFLSAIISTICARMMLGIRAVIDQDDHLSAMRPSDMHISNFNLTPVSMGEAETQSYSNSTSEEQGNFDPSRTETPIEPVTPCTPIPPEEGNEKKELLPDLP